MVQTLPALQHLGLQTVGNAIADRFPVSIASCHAVQELDGGRFADGGSRTTISCAVAFLCTSGTSVLVWLSQLWILGSAGSVHDRACQCVYAVCSLGSERDLDL